MLDKPDQKGWGAGQETQGLTGQGHGNPRRKALLLHFVKCRKRGTSQKPPGRRAPFAKLGAEGHWKTESGLPNTQVMGRRGGNCNKTPRSEGEKYAMCAD